MSLVRYYHTLRYLRPIQFYGRVVHRLYRPGRTRARPAPSLRAMVKRFPTAPAREPSLIAPERFRFLNVEYELGTAGDWNSLAPDKLWLYNLHYFDDLNAAGRDGREPWHRSLIERWIAENPPGLGDGWEPYPTSLRIVNWVKWALSGHGLSPRAERSLAIQCRWLSRRLEYHLLGNHLWRNGKALAFAGTYFNGREAAAWLKTGLGIMEEQLAEQVLTDGGHFERSPMYHSLFIEDLLDLVALSHRFPSLVPGATVQRWRAAASAMLGWLAGMTHPDGEIALFNDAAIGIALRPDKLQSLASALGINPALPSSNNIARLDPSGYIRLTAGDFVLIADVGPIGPDYIPGHAHADTLSFEVSWRGQRVLGNSGTSCYDTGPQRERERSTAAHNTVTVDDQDSSEVWHGFRVARRAKPSSYETSSTDGPSIVTCAHDGYTRLPGRPVHRRQWRLAHDELAIRDEIAGAGEHVATGYLHVEPAVQVTRVGERAFDLDVPGAGRLRLVIEVAGTVQLGDGFVGQEFGKLLPRPVIQWRTAGALPLVANVTIAPLS